MDYHKNKILEKLRKRSEELNVDFIGIVPDTKYKGQSNHGVKFYDRDRGETLLCSSITRFLRGKSLTDEDRHKQASKTTTDRNTLSEEYFINNLKQLYGHKFTFHASDDKRNFWYSCRDCDRDGITLITGVEIFCTSYYSLMDGYPSCHCTISRKWTEYERLNQLDYLVENEEGGEFISLDYSNGSKSHFEWICANGHHNRSRISDFVNTGHRCRGCNGGGFNRNKGGYLYYIKIFKGESSLYKLGISNTPETRWADLIKDNKADGISVLSMWRGEGSHVAKEESRLKSEMNLGVKNTFIVSGMTECSTTPIEVFTDLERVV